MSFLIRQGRAGLLVAVLAVGVMVCLSGCSGGGDAAGPDGSGGGSRINYGTLNDGRDGKSYKTVKIGGTTWMAENLNYQTDSSFCYNLDNSMCDKYGRLYQWGKAVKVCPSGWRLPTQQEWRNLIDAAGGMDVAGKKLITKTGWGDFVGTEPTIGTDNYGFSALPGGAGVASSLFEGGAIFMFEGVASYWWTSTEESTNHFISLVFVGTGDVVSINDTGGNGTLAIYSVRCIQ